MAFYIVDPVSGRLGPYSADDLRRLHASGALRPDARIGSELTEATVPFSSLWAQWQSAAGNLAAANPPSSDSPQPPPLGHAGSDAAPGDARSPLPDRSPPSTPPSMPPPLPGHDGVTGSGEPTGTPGGEKESGDAAGDGLTGRTGQDLRILMPHLALPLDELRSLRWLENRRTLAIAAVGLLPLIIYGLFRHPSQLGNAFWAMALYFSALWALFFYYVFPTPEAKVSTSALCFFVTGLVSVSALLVLYQVWPLSALSGWIQSSHWLVQWVGFVLGVGVPEELCKAFILLVLLRRSGPFQPQTLLFYGLMSGLGFGIYEGVKYQTDHNFEFAQRAAGRSDAFFAAEYYLLNLIRLTTLPFLHAIWTGMAGYFIGFAGQYPARERGLLVVAIGLPALLHGTYNAFSNTLGLVLALISVLALNLYLAKSVEFERLLRAKS